VACSRLADAGILLGSQTVLLKGVNDNADTLEALMRQASQGYLQAARPLATSTRT
jgi:L-lysine 2,3-aminomutase